MFNASATELATFDRTLEPLLARASARAADTEQLAMDATRLLSVRPDQLAIVVKQPFFKRLWGGLTGNTQAHTTAAQTQLFEMQRLSWRYLQLLNERELMLAHTMITVKNNLLTLAVKETETRDMLTMMAKRITDRFMALEQRVDTIEIQQNIHSWLLTLETHDYPDRYPAKLRMLRVIQDFFTLKAGNWSITEIKYLQKALKDVELPWREEITLGDFIDGLIDEIDAHGFDAYDRLIEVNGAQGRIEHQFILDNISASSHKALYKIADSYNHSSDVIDLLADQLSITRREALKRVLRGFIEKEGIDTSITIPLRDLAVELLGCRGLVLGLSGITIARPTAINPKPQIQLPQAQTRKPIDKQGRYLDLGDGVALDTQTNLQWMRCALGQTWTGQTCGCVGEAKQFKWDNAIKVAKDTRHAGYTDWRLPTIDELKKLIVTGQKPTINQQAFPNTPGSWFWSGSPYAGYSDYAWSVYFSDGYAGYYSYRYNSFHVRLVRGGQ
ncbi:hypothetical protein CKO12_01505 [Chromatium okenii]|uniref:Lcl C-terminal domain-containing protein n=1 Tax=Chromatium okenii TaxID=61644 RepID=UPI00190488D2|nr:DUF1566 domain-containing protein [Chromatium okenii]MBK1640575.1 hypothetical protein [Chromatium okenii]